MRKYLFTEEQIKRVIDKVVTEQSANDLIYKGRNFKQEYGYEEPPRDIPVPFSNDWGKQIKDVAGTDNWWEGDTTGQKNGRRQWISFVTPGGKYGAQFKYDGYFYFSDPDDSTKKISNGKWAPNNQGGVTVTMDDGRILTYTPKGGRSPVTITKKGQEQTPAVKSLRDVLGGKGYLAKGMRGPIVGELQKLMLQLNLKISKTGKIDNTFGPIMDLSVKQFQGNNMSKGQMDGKVGQRTLKRMIALRDYDGSKPQVDANQPQMPLDGQNVEPQTSQPQIPTGGDNPTETTAQPEEKLILTPKK